MKRGASLLVLAAGIPLAFAQPQTEAGTQTSQTAGASHEGQSGTLELWKWANFALLVGGLGYLIRKNAWPFFAARSQEIRRSMLEAEELRAEAQSRLAAVEARLANLQAEIEALRKEAAAEEAAETERLRRETAAEMAKIQMQAEQEIAATAKAARLELKRYSAGLALELAAQKIRARITPETQNRLVQSFVIHLDHKVPCAQSS